MSRAHAALATLLCASLLATACGGNDDSPTTKRADTGPLTACQPGKLDDISVAGPFGQQPTVTLQDEVSVEQTQCAVVIAGQGPAAEQDDIVTLDFLFINGRTKEIYGSSFNEAIRPEVPVDDLAVKKPIRGVRQAIQGAKAGSRVVVAMSPEDGYLGGDDKNGLKSTDSLILVADIRSVYDVLQRAEGTPQTPDPALPAVTLADTGAPTIKVPAGAAAPTQLVAKTLIEGDGAVVAEGQEIIARYTGVVWDGGIQFDTTWGKSPIKSDLQIATTEHPAGLIPGWVHGLAGKKVGSQVLLVIPPAEGYGAAGEPNSGIKGTDTLVFVIDILAARDAVAQ